MWGLNCFLCNAFIFSSVLTLQHVIHFSGTRRRLWENGSQSFYVLQTSESGSTQKDTESQCVKMAKHGRQGDPESSYMHRPHNFQYIFWVQFPKRRKFEEVSTIKDLLIQSISQCTYLCSQCIASRLPQSLWKCSSMCWWCLDCCQETLSWVFSLDSWKMSNHGLSVSHKHRTIQRHKTIYCSFKIPMKVTWASFFNTFMASQISQSLWVFRNLQFSGWELMPLQIFWNHSSQRIQPNEVSTSLAHSSKLTCASADLCSKSWFTMTWTSVMGLGLCIEFFRTW